MSTRIRKEEYTSLGDFVRTSFVRDQAIIMARYPKLNADFLASFTAKLEEIKTLESGLILTESQKTVTANLYAEAGILNKELNFLNSYIADAGLNNSVVTAMKSDLFKNNIEGAILKIESVKQFITAHLTALEAEGMAATFPAALEAHKVSLSANNALQNSFMNNRKSLTAASKVQYEALYDFITKIMNAGKLVFDGTITKDEYNITRTIGRMRAPKHTNAA